MEKRKRRTKAEMALARSLETVSKTNENAIQDVQVNYEWASECLKLTGFVNICRSPRTRFAEEWYYTGGDIHDTQDKAKKVASHATVNQVYIECDIKDRNPKGEIK